MVGGDEDQRAVVQTRRLQPRDELTGKPVDELRLQQMPLVLLRDGPGLILRPSCRPTCQAR